MKIKAGLLIVLFLFSAVLPIQAATDEGYGEDEISLGQFVDSFENLDNVSVRYQVERNATLEAMELNFTGSIPLDENYTLYTEIDPNNRFAITDNSIIVSSLSNRDDHHYVYFDYGVGYFTDFTHDLDARGRDDSGTAGNDRMWIWLLANVTDESIDIINANEEMIGIYFQEFDVSDPNPPEISLREYENTVLFIDKFEPAARDTWYYFRIIKLGTSLKVGIYSTAGLRDSGDATDGDIDNLALTLQNDYNFRYIYAVAGLSSGTAQNRLISGDIQNLTIGRFSFGYEPEGYFTTVDYLSDPSASGSALTALFNTSIPANTQILVEFSVDNSTWVFNDWDPLFGGFEAVDLRDLNYSAGFYFRYNLSTTDFSVTPRIYQSRLITTIGEVGADIPGQNVTGEWIEYRASAINASVGIVDGGNLNSTFEIDGDTFNVSEVVGVPGQLISVNFTGVDPDAECVWVTIWYLYDGNLNHDIDIEMWNFSSSAWVDDGHIVDGVIFEWANSTIYSLRIPNDFLSGGEVRVQLNHESPGNINHDLFIDYIRLIAKIPSDVEAEVFQFFWIVIAIALMIVGIVLARMRPDEGDP